MGFNRLTRLTRFTPSGLGVLAGAMASFVGWQLWHYQELAVLAVLGTGVLIVALLDARRKVQLGILRRPLAHRIARGDELVVQYEFANATTRRSISATVIDRFQADLEEIRIPSIPAQRRDSGQMTFQSRRRGEHPVGPARVRRTDGFGLINVERTVPGEVSVLVHPRIYDLSAHSGALRIITDDATVRRRTTDPHAGFQSLRNYVDGDDPRLIHWPTTARTGTLMVREFVEVRRPEFVVVIDTAVGSASDEDFEEVVDVGASIAAFALGVGIGVVLRTTARDRPGSLRPITSAASVLDVLTPLQQSDGPDAVSIPSLFTKGLHSSVVIVTGPKGPSTTPGDMRHFRVVRIGHGAALSTPGVRSLSAENAADFAVKWARWV